MNIYVGNLPFSYAAEQLTALFEPFGEVTSSQVISDRDTGRSRGFGFVEMADEDGRRAISELDGSDVEGRALTVNEARPRTTGGSRGGRPDGGGGRRPGRNDNRSRY